MFSCRHCYGLMRMQRQLHRSFASSLDCSLQLIDIIFLKLETFVRNFWSKVWMIWGKRWGRKEGKHHSSLTVERKNVFILQRSDYFYETARRITGTRPKQMQIRGVGISEGNHKRRNNRRSCLWRVLRAKQNYFSLHLGINFISQGRSSLRRWKVTENLAYMDQFKDVMTLTIFVTCSAFRIRTHSSEKM